MKGMALLRTRWLLFLLLAWAMKTIYAVSECVNGRITFERTPGVRLPSNEQELSGKLQLLKNTAPTPCYRTCLSSESCRGYFIDHIGQNCILLNTEEQFPDNRLIHSDSWSFHRKICLGGKKCHRQWAFDRIRSVQLFGYDDKTLRNIWTRDQCVEACSVEDSFICRSARYDDLNKTCVLSRHDRRTAPEAFRKSTRQVEYLENQCISEPSRCMFHYQTGRGPVHGHVHVQEKATTRVACESACLNHTDFTCRSFVFDPVRSLCLLAPDDSYSSPSGQIQNADVYSFYERGSCIEVQMLCEATSMTVVVRVTTPFRGRVYSMGHPYECYAVSIGANGEVALTMPLHGRKCGTKNLGNGTFVNSVVVQHHPFVLRNTDRRIDVACDYEEVQRKIRGGKQVLEGDMQSLTQVITGLAATPPIRLRVVNESGDEVRGVELGEQLYLKVEMLDESVFGIFGSGLLARSGQGTETVLLIDDRGCPVEPTVFPALKKKAHSKSLLAPFQAFKFASDSTVKFQLTVSFCLDLCSPVNCEDLVSNSVHESYGRKRRSPDIPDKRILELQSGDVVSDVTMESSLFVVTTLKSAHPTADSHHNSIAVPKDRNPSVQVSEKGLCLTRPLIYTFAIIGGITQLIFFGSCILLVVFVRKCHRRPIKTGSNSSRASVSSKTDLFYRS